MLGEAAMAVQTGRLLTARAAWKLDQGDFARKEVSMAKVQVADALQRPLIPPFSSAARAAIPAIRRWNGCIATPARPAG